MDPPHGDRVEAEPPGERPADRRAWLRARGPNAAKVVGGWTAGIVAAVVGGLLITKLTPLVEPEPSATPSSVSTPAPTADEPLAVAVVASGPDPCGAGYLVPLAPAAVPIPPVLDESPTSDWAGRVGGLPAVRTDLTFTVQGRSDTVVTLLGLDIKIDRRASPPAGTHVSWLCGSGVALRHVQVDLDRVPPRQSAHFDEESADQLPPAERRPIRFPYRVSRTDPETFEVSGLARTCDCSWHVELRWAADGRTGTYVIDDGGRPFRTVGLANAQASCQMAAEWSCGPPVDW